MLPPLTSNRFGRWRCRRRVSVFLWCLAALYTLCILDIRFVCVCIYVKCHIVCVHVQGPSVRRFITPQQSRRSPPQQSAVSRKASRKTHREGCLSCWNWRQKRVNYFTNKKIIDTNIDTLREIGSYHVWALGKFSVLASIKWMVKSLGPAEPVEPYTHTF